MIDPFDDTHDDLLVWFHAAVTRVYMLKKSNFIYSTN